MLQPQDPWDGAGFVFWAIVGIALLIWSIFIMRDIDKQLNDPATSTKPIPEKYKKYPEYAIWSTCLGVIAIAISLFTPNAPNAPNAPIV